MSYLHKDKIRICLPGFGWTQFTSRDSLSCKTRWEYLSSRRKYRKLIALYKMLNSLCPQILGNCLPLTVYDHYLRNDENYATPWAGWQWSPLRRFYGRNNDLVDVMEYLCHKWPWIYFNDRKHFPILSPFETVLRILIKRISPVKIYLNEWINTVVLGYTPVGSSCIHIISLSS